MRVLVTGATGFVGRHVVPRLLDAGHDVTTVVRDPARLDGFSWRADVRPVVYDLHAGDAHGLGALAAHDALVHLAWPGLPNYRELFHFERNLPADYAFVKALVEGDLGRVLVTGTCFEYGMREGRCAEHMPAAPANPYALAKDTLRRFLEELQRTRPFVLQWARLFYMYGDGQNPGSLVAQLDRAIASGASEFDMSGGEQLRDYLPVEAVADRLALLVEHPECSGVINVCSGRPISVRRLVEQRLEQAGAALTLNLGRYPYPAHEPMAFWGDDSKLSAIPHQTR